MARFDTSGLDDLIRDMTRRGESSGPMAEAMVAAATVEIKAAWRESAEAHKLRKTGDMIDAIGTPGPVMKIGDVRQALPFSQKFHPALSYHHLFIMNFHNDIYRTADQFSRLPVKSGYITAVFLYIL